MKRFTIEELEAFNRECQWCGGKRKRDCHGDGSSRTQPCWFEFVRSNLDAERIIQENKQ
jgi:hypothetical protein